MAGIQMRWGIFCGVVSFSSASMWFLAGFFVRVYAGFSDRLPLPSGASLWFWREGGQVMAPVLLLLSAWVGHRKLSEPGEASLAIEYSYAAWTVFLGTSIVAMGMASFTINWGV